MRLAAVGVMIGSHASARSCEVNKRRYVRLVSPSERYALALNRIHHYHVVGVIEGNGHVNPILLQAAVDRAANTNPAIRVRLHGYLAFCRWVDCGLSPKVRTLPMADWDGKSEQGAPFLLERLDVDNHGSVADILLVPCRDGKTRLVFRALHAAIDGRGLLHWMAEVFRALRGETLKGSDSRLVDIDLQSHYQELIPASVNSAPSTCIPVMEPAHTDHETLHYVWRRLIIEKSVSQLLPKTATFLANWARQNAAGEVKFTIPIDYRGLRTQEMGIGNLTGYLQLTVPDGATPRDLMRQLGEHIRNYADCRLAHGVRMLLWLPIWFTANRLRRCLDNMLYTESSILSTGGIVSLGNYSAEAHSFTGFKCSMGYGIPGAVGKFNVVFVNCPDCVVITFAAPAAYNHRGQMDNLVAAYQREFSATRSKHCLSTPEAARQAMKPPASRCPFCTWNLKPPPVLLDHEK